MRGLNYFSKRSAQSLAFRQTGNIGFILTEDHFGRAEPFYTKVFLGTEFETHSASFYILLTTIPFNFKLDQHMPRSLRERNVDGILRCGLILQALSDYIRECKMPHVCIDFLPRIGTANAVLMDYFAGGKKAVKHLLVEVGHRKIAFIGGEMTHPSILARLAGYRQDLSMAKLASQEDLIVARTMATTFDHSYAAAAATLVQMHPECTAIFATNDAMAPAAIRYLRDRKIPVAAQTSIVGFDNVEACAHPDHSLTTIGVHKEELGAIALRLLIEMVQNKRAYSGTFIIPRLRSWCAARPHR